jgi:hypothetical protein
MYLFVLEFTDCVINIIFDVQANTKQSTGCVHLNINLLKPSRIEFQEPVPAPPLALPHGHPSSASPGWLEYVYRTSHPVLRLGGLTVEETALKKSAVREEQVKRAVETSRRWKAARASSK